MADKIKLFGRSYNQIGNSDADVIIKTKGQLKLQYGNKFIDLIKDGKLNVNTEFIFKAKSIDDIAGNDGIYVCDDGSIYLKVEDSPPINLIGEVGTTYVTFLAPQETTPDQKHQALVNIGFLHESLDSIDQNSLQNGIVYIESEQKLYTIVNGTITELIVSFPNPFTSQFVIAKTTSEKGSILIKGTGIENSLAFESLFIYTDGEITNFDSDKDIIYNIGGTQVLSLSALSALFNVPVSGSMFQSPSANKQTGFRLYIQKGESYLEVDNLILRNQDKTSSIHLFPEYWLMRNNIILQATIIQLEEVLVPNQLSIELSQSNEFNIGEIVAFYKKSTENISMEIEVEDYDENGNVIGTHLEEQFQEIERYSRVEGEIIAIKNNIITVNCTVDFNAQEADSLSQQFIYLIKSSTTDIPIRVKDNNIDIVKYSDQKDENGNLISSIKTRIGNLTDLNLDIQKDETQIDKVQDSGIYSELAVFGLAKLLAGTLIPDDDNSSTLASTSWVRKLLQNIIPSGTITAFHGTSIPDGWAPCTGENGTPDLRDKFIKGGTIEETSSISSIVTDSTQPTTINIDCYSLVFIMKL